MTIVTKLSPLGWDNRGSNPYDYGYLIYEGSASDSTTKSLEAGLYEVSIVGGGGGAGGGLRIDSYYNWASGGSAAAWKGDIKLPKGSYSLVVGAAGSNYGGTTTQGVSGNGTAGGNSTLTLNSSNLIIAGAGGGAKGSAGLSGLSGGSGGTLDISGISGYQYTEVTASSGNGTSGGTKYSSQYDVIIPGARASKQPPYGRGGCYTATLAGQTKPLAGYMKIMYLGSSQNDKYLIGSDTSGTTTYTVPKTGKYLIKMVGGGGGSIYCIASSRFVASGGSGAFFSGIIRLTSGDELSIVTGTGGTSLMNTSATSTQGGGLSKITVNGTEVAKVTGGAGGRRSTIPGGSCSYTESLFSGVIALNGNAGTLSTSFINVEPPSRTETLWDHTLTGNGSGGGTEWTKSGNFYTITGVTSGKEGAFKLIYKGP